MFPSVMILFVWMSSLALRDDFLGGRMMSQMEDSLADLWPRSLASVTEVRVESSNTSDNKALRATRGNIVRDGEMSRMMRSPATSFWSPKGFVFTSLQEKSICVKSFCCLKYFIQFGSQGFSFRKPSLRNCSAIYNKNTHDPSWAKTICLGKTDLWSGVGQHINLTAPSTFLIMTKTSIRFVYYLTWTA